MSGILRILFLLITVLTITQALSGSRAGVKNILRNAPTVKAAPRAQFAASKDEKVDPEKPKSKAGISAWGIVALIISFILLCMGTYYTILFYPLLCAKERKYDIIDLSPV